MLLDSSGLNIAMMKWWTSTWSVSDHLPVSQVWVTNASDYGHALACMQHTHVGTPWCLARWIWYLPAIMKCFIMNHVSKADIKQYPVKINQ